MKTRFTILSLFVLISLNTFAQKWLSVNADYKPINKIELIKSSDKEMIIDVNVNNYYKKSIDNQAGVVINSKGASALQKKGAPDLPKMVSSLVIPNNKKMYVEYFDVEYTDIQNIDVLPSRGAISRAIDPTTVPYTYGAEYNVNEFFPNTLASLSNPYIMRDVRGVTVQFTPFQYNPVTKTLRVYTHYKVRVYTNGDTDNINVLSTTKAVNEIQSDFATIYKRHFLNYAKGNEKYTPIEEGTPGRMLIISYGDFIDEMQAFVDWKNQKGIATEIVDVATIGNSAAIKTYVQDYYNNHADFSYLLLVGDNAQVPASSTSAGDSDNNYGYLAGNDHRIDIFVGRFSAETSADVVTQVERTIHYEKDITESETWMQHALCIASSEGGGSQGDDGESDITHETNIGTDFTNYGYLDYATCFQGTGEDVGDISTAINLHTGVITYTGHGDVNMWYSVDPSGYTNTHVNALTNENELPFIFTVACVSGDFTSNTCFGEAWQRATNGGNPTGAIANIASTINQSWNAPMCAQDEMVDILTESYANNIKRTFGGLSANGWGQMIDEYTSDGENMADTWTCFGDASVMVRTKQPQVMAISHASGINIGSTSFNVNCDVDGALVSITKNNSILGTGYATGGSVNVALNPAVSGAGTVLVTVTAYNKVTYQQTVNIITSSNPPVCDFSGTPLTILEGETVAFTDLSTEYPTSWSWTFAGGTPSTSTLMNPTITYTTAGTYEVTLYVENANGNDAETKTAYVTVNPNTNAPTPDFSANVTSILVGGTVDFTDLTTNNPQSWAWEFEGATPSTSTDQNPVNITYNTAGIYQVSLTATNTNGSNTETKVSYITVSIPDPCDAGASNEWEKINGFACGSINNQNSGFSANGYGDFTNMSTDIVAGNTYSATVTISNVYSADQVYAWADWNMDADFDDAGENIFNSSTNGQSSYTFNFTVPANVATGNIRLRVRLNDTGSNPSVTAPCGVSAYGEVEDYTLIVSPVLNVENTVNDNLFNVYPNPNNGTFTVATIGNVETISVVTMTGKIVYSENVNSDINTIQLNELEKGIYFVKVQNKDNIQVKKIIIE